MDISSDKLERLHVRRPGYNKEGEISREKKMLQEPIILKRKSMIHNRIESVGYMKTDETVKLHATN